MHPFGFWCIIFVIGLERSSQPVIVTKQHMVMRNYIYRNSMRRHTLLLLALWSVCHLLNNSDTYRWMQKIPFVLEVIITVLCPVHVIRRKIRFVTVITHLIYMAEKKGNPPTNTQDRTTFWGRFWLIGLAERPQHIPILDAADREKALDVLYCMSRFWQLRMHLMALQSK